MDINKTIRDNFKKLSRGLMQPNYPVAYEAHKILYEIGQPVIPILKEKIFDIEWSNSKYKELSGYVSGLYSLLHDLDEDEALRICEKVISNGCPKHIKSILKSINQFSVKNYKRYHVKGIEVFEHMLVDAKCDISHYLDSWMSQIPENDLEFISRIYVITRDEINASGTYTPILNSIALLWENSYKDKSLLFRFFSRVTELVFYHEIGHHKHRHTFGTDPEQEKEADRYAFGIMRRKYPIFFGFIKFLRMMGLKSSTNYYRWGL
ncbi:MAG: hypothetical protein QNJ04_08580 [Desulfobacterales bacterium]|nr:hypothetical protein [Desulfobacterales bacterium]